MPKKSQSLHPALVSLSDDVDLIRFEKNLLQIGFFGAHERRGDKISERSIEQWVNRDGKKIKVSAHFRSSSTLGLPSTSDRDKYMAFMKLAMETRMKTGALSNPIRFSGYSLLRTLGQSDSGENYEALNTWGQRMADTTITSEQIMYSSSVKKYMNKTVHVFRSFTRIGSSNLDNSGKTDFFEIELEDWLLDNINASYVVPEDLTVYRKLTRPTAKGIFVYLHVWFYASQGREVEKDYAELCTLLNVRKYEHVSKIRETMGMSLAELVSVGYLKSWDIRTMSSKPGYKLVLTAGRAIQEILTLTQRKQLSAPAKTDLTEQREALKAALISAGISSTKAIELAREYEPTTLQDRFEYALYQLQHDSRETIKNPPGFLISFIEGDQLIPPYFEFSRQRAEREAKELAERTQQEDQERAQADSAQKTLLYQQWCECEANLHIEHSLPGELLEKKLKQIASQLRAEPPEAAVMKRMTQGMIRNYLMRRLRTEIISELNLPSLADWTSVSGQSLLF